MDINGQKNGQKGGELRRWQKRTETHKDGQKHKGTDKNRHKRTEMD